MTEALTAQLRSSINLELKRDYDKQLAEAKVGLAKEAEAKAEANLGITLKDLQEQLAEQQKSLAEAQLKELELRKHQRLLQQEKESFELKLARTLDAERQKIRESVETAFAEQHQLKDEEKDRKIAEMKRQIDDLQRRANQGPQQAQGETLEEGLEATLRQTFGWDEIIPVTKGQKGGDVLQVVRDSSTGRECGRILWEAKNTQKWSNGWIEKIKEDAQVSKAHLAVIVSAVLHKGVKSFGQVSGVWVTSIASYLSLAAAFREFLIREATLKASAVGKNEKMELLYGYLTGPEFRRRVGAIAAAFSQMQKQLSDERRAMDKIWAQREKQITAVSSNIAGMYGDLQGVSGSALPDVPSLALPAAPGREIPN